MTMKRTEAQCKINGLVIAEATINNYTGMPSMEATYALLEHGSGMPMTHGKCTANQSNWSGRTIELMEELIESMSDDLMAVHFNIERKEILDAERTESGGTEGPLQV
jgi:hypothetical protein